MKLPEQFKRAHLPVALVVDEFGDVEGLVSLTDVIASIVGDLPAEPGFLEQVTCSSAAAID